jgi:hypothetical protein
MMSGLQADIKKNVIKIGLDQRNIAQLKYQLKEAE